MKNRVSKFVLFAVVLFAQLAALAAPTITPAEMEEIKNFASLEHGKGHLLTPPRGAISTEVRAVRNYVKALVEELVGPQLKAKDAHYVINVYGNDTMNAWVQQFNPTEDESSERNWLVKHPGEVWPLRAAWGFPNDQKPIYEIGITTGLLRSLNTIDELAFILGHETTHLLENHTDHGENIRDSIKRWWSSQSYEVVADYLGLEKILGKYELDAALSVMEKLHPRGDDQMSVSDALRAGTSTHHAEGVRVSALQFNIEYLRRFNRLAVPRAQIAIPASMKLSVSGRETKPVIMGKPEARENYFKYVKAMSLNYFPKLSVPLYIEINDTETKNKDGRGPFQGLLGSDKHRSFAQLLIETAELIDQAPSRKAVKMNAFFQSMILLGSRAFNYGYESEDWFQGLEPQQMFKLTRFLLKNSAGEDAWTFSDYRKMMNALPFAARTNIEMPLMGSAKGQKLLSELIQISPAWNQLLNHWSSIDSFLIDGKYEMAAFTELLHLLNDADEERFPDGPLKDLYRKRTAESFAQVKDEKKLFAKLDKQGLSEFKNFVFDVDPKTRPETQAWHQSLKEARAKFEPAYRQTYFGQVIRLMNKKDKTPMDVAYLTFVLSGIKLEELTASERAQLENAYENVIQETLYPVRKRYGYSGSGLLSREDMNFTAQLMQSNWHDRAKVLRYLRYILISSDPSYFEARNLPKETLDTFKRLAQSLTKEELLSLTETLSPLEQEVVSEVRGLSKRLGVTSRSDLYLKVLRIENAAERMSLVEKSFSWDQALTMQYRMQANIPQFVSLYGEGDLAGYRQFSLSELNRVLSRYEVVLLDSKFSNQFEEKLGSPIETARVLFALYLRNLASIPTFEFQVKTYERILKIAGTGFMPSLEEETRLKEVFGKALKGMPPRTQFQWLKNEKIRKSMGGEFVGETLANYIYEITKNDRARLNTEVERVMAAIPLREKWPDAFVVFRNKLAEKSSVQPFELKTVFKEDTRTITQKVDTEGNLIRGMSAFSTFTRAMPPEEQLEMIEFIMGRSTKMPKTLAEYKDSYSKNKVDVRQLFLKLREELKFRTPLERSMVVNSVFTGPNGLPAKAGGLDIIHDHLLRSISPANRELARVLLNGLSAAEGRNKTLILSYALAQRSEGAQAESALTEATVLRSLLDFYGVPGVKLAQYLAFTAEFKNLQPALESYQDAAMPISYYDALLLLMKRLGDSWDPARYRVIKIIGSGSVNVAIEYLNLQTGKSEVISVARDEIEVKTAEDFRRFHLLLVELTRTPELKRQFDFVVGLMDLIQKSVTLEFDKKNSFEMQKSVQNLYRRTVDGWNIRTVDAYSVEGMAIRMEKAQGIGARKILKNNPAAYESAMRAFMQVEYAVLRGVNETNNWLPVPLFANPDIHDGQFLIDLETKSITVLDFGQAIKISNQEREFALDLLRVISNAESVPSSETLIQKYATLFLKKKISLNKTELTDLLARGDRMDVFVHLLSTLSRSGFEVPLPTVHWVLAANRLIKLGEKVHLSPESSIKWMLGMRKLNLPLGAFNAAKDMADKVKGSFSSAPSGGSGLQCSALFSAM